MGGYLWVTEIRVALIVGRGSDLRVEGSLGDIGSRAGGYMAGSLFVYLKALIPEPVANGANLGWARPKRCSNSSGLSH